MTREDRGRVEGLEWVEGEGVTRGDRGRVEGLRVKE